MCLRALSTKKNISTTRGVCLKDGVGPTGNVLSAPPPLSVYTPPPGVSKRITTNKDNSSVYQSLNLVAKASCSEMVQVKNTLLGGGIISGSATTRHVGVVIHG